MTGKRIADSNGRLTGRRSEITIKDSRERVASVTKVLVGYRVRSELTDGSVYEGIFHKAALEESAAVVLKMAHVVASATRQPAAKTKGSITGVPPGWFDRLELPLDELVHLTASNVRMDTSDLSDSAASNELAGFGTDSTISQGRGGGFGRERVLQKWRPSADDAALEGIEDSAMGGGGGGSGSGWDQFAAAANQIAPATAKPSFHEDFYTTPLDMSTSRISPAAALRVAKQIETDNRNRGFGGGGSGNAHLDEERGLAVDDDLEMDEEEKYSSVQRAAPSSSETDSRTSPATSNASAPQPVPVPAAGRSAWSSAGSSIAAISGRGAAASAAGSSMPRPIPGRSAAIDTPSSVNARREHNRVAMQMGTPGSRKDRSGSSPYGTPSFSRSPLSSSPLVRDAAAMEALNLDAGSGRKLDKAQEVAFREFKARQAAEKAQKELEDTKRRVMSYKASVDGTAPSVDFSVSDNNSPLDGSMMLSDVAPALSASPAASNASMPPLPLKLRPSLGKSDSPQPVDKAAGKAEGSSTQPSTPFGRSDTPATSKKLNPMAKAFSFNPSATTFTPGTARSTSGSIGGSGALRSPSQQPGASPFSGGGSGGRSGGDSGQTPRPQRANSMSRKSSGGHQFQGHPGAAHPEQQYGHHRQPLPPLPPHGLSLMQGGTPPHQQPPGPPHSRQSSITLSQGGRTPPRPSQHHATSPLRQPSLEHGHNRSASGSGGAVPSGAFGMSPGGPPSQHHMGHMGSGPLPPMRHPPQPPGGMGPPQHMMHPDGGPPRDGRNGGMPRPGMGPGQPPMGMQLVQGPMLMHSHHQPGYGVPSPQMAVPGSPLGVGGYQGGFAQSPPMSRPPYGASAGGGYPAGPPLMLHYPHGGPPPPEPPPGMRPAMYGPPHYSPGGGPPPYSPSGVRPMGPMGVRAMPPPPHNGLSSPSRPSPSHIGPAHMPQPLLQNPNVRPGAPQYRPGGPSGPRGLPHNVGGVGGAMRLAGPMPMSPQHMSPGGPGGPPTSPYQQWNGHQPSPPGHHPNGGGNFQGGRPRPGPSPPGPRPREQQRSPSGSLPAGPRRPP